MDAWIRCIDKTLSWGSTNMIEINVENGSINIHVKERAKASISLCAIMHMVEVQSIKLNVVVKKHAKLKLISSCGSLVGGRHESNWTLKLEEGARCYVLRNHVWNNKVKVKGRTSIFCFEHAYFKEITIVKQSALSEHLILNGSVGRGASFFSYLGAEIGQDSKLISQTNILLHKNAKAKVISRGACAGKMEVRDKLTAVERARGHLSCNAILLNKEANFLTSPTLHAKTKDAILTHEAGIGRINEQEITYLMSKGVDRSKAKNLIIKHFIVP